MVASLGGRGDVLDPGGGWRPARVRTLVAAVIVGLVATLTFAVEPAVARPSAGAGDSRMSASTAVAAASAQRVRIGHDARIWWGPNNSYVRASAWIDVFNNRTKDLYVCDSYGGDNMVLAIQIDPSGGGPPDTLVYRDANGTAPGCLRRTIGYPVRKWRFVSVRQNGAPHDFNHPWKVAPLPRPDF